MRQELIHRSHLGSHNEAKFLLKSDHVRQGAPNAFERTKHSQNDEHTKGSVQAK